MISPLDTVSRFRNLRALVVGDLMLDSYLEGTASRLCREGPVPVISKTSEERAPGGAANTAANMRALGAQVSLLGVVGTDTAGDHLLSALQGLNVDTRYVVRDQSTSTLHKLRILANGQYVVRFDEGDTSTCSPGVHEQLLARLNDAFQQCDLVLVSDYDYGVLSDALLAQLQALRHERPCMLLVDSKNLPRYQDIEATVLTPNHFEASAAIGWTSAPDKAPRLTDVEEAGKRLLRLTGADHTAVTMAGDGVLLVSRSSPTKHLPAQPVMHPHDVGAGDSFAAATALALAVGADPAEAVRIGIDAAGVAVLRERTSIVRHQELLQAVGARLQSHEGGTPDLALKDVENARRAGRSVVFTNGVFDILHAGHVGFLRRARALGDMLVVGVNSDASTRRLKGSGRPVISEQDRVALVSALDCVDHALLFEEDTPAEVIRRLRPHIHVKGSDYADGPLPEAEAVEEIGGQVVILPLVEGHSTSGVIDRIAALALSGPGGNE